MERDSLQNGLTVYGRSHLVPGFPSPLNIKLIETVKVIVNDISETRKDVVVTFSPDEVTQEESRIVKAFIKQAKIPGFRPGKAPEARVRQLYTKQIAEELKNGIMRSAYEEIMKQEDLEVYTIVDFHEPAAIPAGQELNIDLTVDINPSFELPEYKGIATEPPSTEVEDSEIDETIERIRRQRADFVVVEREATKGDYVKVSYTGTVDGEPIADALKDNPRVQAWGQVSQGWEEAGTDEAKEFGVPAVIEALVGLKAGDTTEGEQEDRRGKTVKYAIEALEVRERKMPEIDEEFLKSVNAETLEDFKAQIMDDLEGRKKQEAQDAQRNQILDFLDKSVSIPLPESAVQSETQNAMARIINQNMQMGIQEEEFEKHKEEIFAGAFKTAEREVKLQIVLNRIARKEEVTVENEDLSRAVYSMAMQRRQKPEDLAKELRKDRSQLLNLQRQILFAKTLDLLLKECSTEKA